MSEQGVSTVDVNGFAIRVWRKGQGRPLDLLASPGGLPRWVPCLDHLAATREVIAPFPGGDRGHSVLDNPLGWLVAVPQLLPQLLRQLLVKAGLDGADLAGSSVGASLAAEMAALWSASVRRLSLIAPFGLFDAADPPADPPADPWAQRPDALPGLMTADPAHWLALKVPPEDTNSIQWPIEQTRASEAAARLFWPPGNTRLEQRLPLIVAPTLLAWCAEDRVMPRSYAARIAGLLGGPHETQVIPGAGHLAELDRPEEVADTILQWSV